MKTRSLLWVGIGSFIAFLIATAPIASIYPRIAPPGSPLQLTGLSGSVFSGSAGSLSYQGRSLAKPLNWTFSPLALIAARLGFHINGSVDGLLFDGHVSRTLGGNIVVSSLAASGGLKGLLALSGDAQLPIDGDVGVKLEELILVEKFPKQASADIDIVRLRWTLGRNPLVLGDFKMVVTTEAGVIVAKVSPTGGPLDVGGELRLNTDRSYEIDLKVKAKPEAEPAVQNLVRTLGQPDTQGYYRIKSRAQL
ncbi:type II secretion system protein N [uncultured Nevskia sp.]|uniref:type II secretion system protein N n=1 Tax=uncultured Nevskia sp. TaxID=228950 RepID=UPI0025DD93EF|nr:type II secretion system protein N [uncultured Nevskia sp.]